MNKLSTQTTHNNINNNNNQNKNIGINNNIINGNGRLHSNIGRIKKRNKTNTQTNFYE